MRVHTAKRPYQCDFCDESFEQLGTLIIHMEIHNRTKEDVSEDPCINFEDIKQEPQVIAKEETVTIDTDNLQEETDFRVENKIEEMASEEESFQLFRAEEIKEEPASIEEKSGTNSGHESLKVQTKCDEKTPFEEEKIDLLKTEEIKEEPSGT